MASRVSKIYGDAYISLMQKENKIKEAMEEVKTLGQVFDDNADFLRLLHHPEITKEEKIKVTKQVLKDRVSKDMEGFVMTILKKGRSQDIHDIFSYILDQMKHLQGIGVLKVISAKPLDDQEKSKIEHRVLEITNYTQLEVVYTVDEGIIGGLILTMDERVVDNSIRTKLSNMGKHLSQIQLS